MANGKRTADSRLREYEYLDCRLRRHQWERQGEFLLKDGRDRYIVFRFVCLTCGCRRTDIYDKNGELDERRYQHARGYLLTYTAEEREAGERVTTRTIARYMIKQHLKDNDLPAYEAE